MEKKQAEAPVMEIVIFGVEDVITASDPLGEWD